MGKIVPVGKVVGSVIGAVTGQEAPKAPTVPVIVNPEVPAEVTTTKDEPEKRNAGMGATVLTSLRGLLNVNNFSPQRKSLLGE